MKNFIIHDDWIEDVNVALNKKYFKIKKKMIFEPKNPLVLIYSNEIHSKKVDSPIFYHLVWVQFDSTLTNL